MVEYHLQHASYNCGATSVAFNVQVKYHRGFRRKTTEDDMARELSELRSQCPIAASLDLLGDRWTLLILRDLLFVGNSEFSEFAAREGIATNTLSERLQRLLEAGLLVRHRHKDDGRRWTYSPTPAAVELIPVLVELMLWGTRHTKGNAPALVLDAATSDKAALIERMTTIAKERLVDR